MCKVSVIVPIYNKGKYLRECLNSLINQTLQDIEIICIDDKSSDDSRDILAEYADKDPRIKLVLQDENHGVSIARNLGISKATGEFIAFVDADDFVEADFYEKLYLASSGYECIKGEIWNYDIEISACTPNTLYNLNDIIKKTADPIYFYCGFTSAIYRRAVIIKNNIHFPENVSYFEDPYFSITLATKLSSIKVVDDAKYFYRSISSGLSSNVTHDKLEDFFTSIKGIFSYLKNCDLSLERMYVIANQLFSITSSWTTDIDFAKEKINYLRQEYLTLLSLPQNAGEAEVSVIVPVYNGSRYLRRTLDCLTFQSLRNLEIICVNDKSTDNSLEILREYQKNDKRIKIIDCKENGGESKARNIGIHAAAGEYIAFMDQDDRVDLYFYEKLYEKAVETKADIVKGNVDEILYNGQKTTRTPCPVTKNPLYFSGDWWTAIYRRTLIINNNILLPEGLPLGGDLKFLFDACMACNKVVPVNDVFYHHLMHPDSGDSEFTSTKKMKSVIEVFTYILSKIEKSNLYETDKDCYTFFYLSYLLHAYMRIERCSEWEGKKMCIDFMFRVLIDCRTRNDVLGKVHRFCPFLGDIMENNRKEHFELMLKSDELSELYYGISENKQPAASVDCNIITPFINREIVDKYIVNNHFLKKEKNITYNFIDNRKENRAISVIYNEFLNNYDYEKESWLIFMHSDFEFLSFPSDLLQQLDKSKIYGPCGTKIHINKGKVFAVVKGGIIEKASRNTMNIVENNRISDMSAETLDCMCLIVHSSLIQKYSLRFDENTIFDLYVEDFCLTAIKKHAVSIEVAPFNCGHHSAYYKEKCISRRYLKQLEYINAKYKDDLYGGTVSHIGGKILPEMNDREICIFWARQKQLEREKNEQKSDNGCHTCIQW